MYTTDYHYRLSLTGPSDSLHTRLTVSLCPSLCQSIYGESIPLLVIGGVSVVSGLFTLLLPETLGLPLPETMHDAVSAVR